MGVSTWRALGWLGTNKKGQDIARCDSCNKVVPVTCRGHGEIAECICNKCGEVVLDE